MIQPSRQRIGTSSQRVVATQRLLLLSCSQRKIHTTGRMPALERYDGPAFQVVRRYLREVPDPRLDVHVLSAQYGLISSGTRITDYDRKMDRDRALQLRERCLSALRKLLSGRRYVEVFVCMSHLYLTGVDGIELLHRNVRHASPGQGRKLGSLYRWLRGQRQ